MQFEKMKNIKWPQKECHTNTVSVIFQTHAKVTILNKKEI